MYMCTQQTVCLSLFQVYNHLSLLLSLSLSLLLLLLYEYYNDNIIIANYNM